MTITFNQKNKDWEILSIDKCIPAKDIKKIKILSYNVWTGSHNYSERCKEIKNIIVDLDPDIICF